MDTQETHNHVSPRCPAEIIKARIAVMKAVSGVGKTGHNSFHKYDYASDFDVLTAVREPMLENGLALEMWPVSIETDEDKNMRVKFMMQWQHESGALSEPMPWYGVANDKDKSGKNGDKWFNKAATAAEKYFLLKQLHIPASKDMDPDAGNADTDNQQQNTPAPAAARPPEDPAARARAEKYVTAQLAMLPTIKSPEEFDGWREQADQQFIGLKNYFPDLHKTLLEASQKQQAALSQPLAAE